MNKMKDTDNKMFLPSLRGHLGDRVLYITFMRFKDIADRVKMTDEIHTNQNLSNWIQREVNKRSDNIVEYLKTQGERFFNSLVLGIYGGNPSWSGINVDIDTESPYNFSETEYSETRFELNTKVGLLSLCGDEKIFAIDGQHRVSAIKQIVAQNATLHNEEVAVILLAHATDSIGIQRTRRLFSTLNRYAVPVNLREIIALDEDDNGAIITRNLIENYNFFYNSIDISQSSSISPKNKHHFSNIISLYNSVITYFTGVKALLKVKSPRYQYKDFTTCRLGDPAILENTIEIDKLFSLLFDSVPALRKYREEKYVDRSDPSTSLLFRPIGQSIFFTCVTIASEYEKTIELFHYFGTKEFSLLEPFWKQLFWNTEAEVIITTKEQQKVACIHILKEIGVELDLTNKMQLTYQRYTNS